MAEQTGPFRWLAKLAYVALLASFVFLALLLAGSVALAAQKLLADWSWEQLVRLVLPILAILIATLWAAVLYGVVRLILSNETSVRRSAGRLERVETVLQEQSVLLEELTRLSGLSDQTKNIASRDRQLEAIRDAFHDSLTRQDPGASEALIQSVAATPAFADEAERMRKELTESRQATEAEKIDIAIGRIQAIVDDGDWARAQRAIQRLLARFPQNKKVAALPERLQGAQSGRKRQLLQEYGDAVRKNDVDRGIDLLRQLDPYLTPQEAAALEESARGVFRAKLHNLGVQFALRVTEEQWAQAVAVGEQIVREYPNSRMAQEVQNKMDRLRTLAEAPPPPKA